MTQQTPTEMDRPTSEDQEPETAPKGIGRLLAAAGRTLPRGIPLPEASWQRRHRVIVILVWSHALGLVVFGIVRGAGFGHSLFEGSLVAAFALTAGIARTRRMRAVMASMGILSSSAVLVHLSGGTIEAHFHFFVMMGVISLYQDWTPFLLAVGYVVVHHGTVGVFDPASVYNHPAALANPWLWAGIHGLFILGACTVSLIAWRMNEDARARAEEYYRRLYEGERTVADELREAQRMKDELIAMVSHELRTPLTAIIGFSHTLADFWDKLTAEERKESLDASLRQAERLRRHVENLLEAARVSERDPLSRASLHDTVQTAIQELGDLPGAEAVAIDAEVEAVDASISGDALHLVAVNLIGNAIKYAQPGSVVGVVGGRMGESNRVFLSVTNLAPPIDEEDISRMFDPFVRLDAEGGSPASGMGLGLHIVQRVVDLHDGKVDAVYCDGRVTFRVELDACEPGPAGPRPTLSSRIRHLPA